MDHHDPEIASSARQAVEALLEAALKRTAAEDQAALICPAVPSGWEPTFQDGSEYTVIR